MSWIIGTFLVFAGMLIRHFLSGSDRAGEEEARLALIRENEELRGEVTQLTGSHTQLDEQCSRQKGQLNVLQQLCDDWSATREKSERIRAQLESDLTNQKGRSDKFAADLELEKQKRIGLEDQLHSLAQTNIEKITSLESQWRTQHAEVESSLLQRQGELTSKTSENERLSDQLHQSQARVAELESQIKINERMLETAQKNASGLEKEYVTLETSMRESSELLNDARRECAEALSVRKVAEESLTMFKSQQATLQQDYDQVRARLAAAEEIGRQNASLKESIESVRSELSRVTAQRDQAMQDQQAVMTKASGLQARIDNQETTIHNLRDSRSELTSTVKQKELICSQLESELARRSTDLQEQLKLQAEALTQQSHQQVSNQRRQREALEVQLAEHGKTISQVVSERETLEAQLAAHDQTISEVAAERDALSDQLSEIKTQLEHVGQTLSERDESIEQLSNEVAEVGTMQVRIRELEALLQRRESEMQELNVTSSEAELLREQFSNLQDQYAIARRRQVELEANLERLQEERKQDQSTEHSYRDELEQYRTKLTASADTIRTLRKERAAVLARLANYRTIAEPNRAVISFTQAMEMQKKQAEAYDEEYGGHTTVHAKRGRIYVSEPETRDDLKRISGIAEVLEARLNDYGIYTFKQIMEWSKESIDEFSNLLTFRDRIERDDWQHQARYFYDQKNVDQEKFAA